MRIISVFKNDVEIKDLENLINSGDAFNKFILMVEAHGGSIGEFERMEYQNPKFKYSIESQTDGYIESFDTKKIGEKLSIIGGGRFGNNDGIDNYSGLQMHKKISDSVIKGEPIIEFYCSSEKKINNLRMETDSIFKVSENKCDAPALIYQGAQWSI